MIPLLLLGGAALLYFGASRSRKRKQRVIEARWRSALPGRLVAQLAIIRVPLDPAASQRLASEIFEDIYRTFGARDFGQLMRRFVEAEESNGDTLVADICARAATRLPSGDSAPATIAIFIQRAIEAAGGEAQQAGDASGEV